VTESVHREFAATGAEVGDTTLAEPAQFRLVLVSLLAAAIGLIAGGIAFLLYKLIGLLTNISMLLDGEGKLAGIITRADVLRALDEDPSGIMSLREAGSRKVIVTYPDETLHEAVVKMLRNNIGRLPVVDRKDPRRIVGYLWEGQGSWPHGCAAWTTNTCASRAGLANSADSTRAEVRADARQILHPAKAGFRMMPV
jgi:CBS domain-containing protein